MSDNRGKQYFNVCDDITGRTEDGCAVDLGDDGHLTVVDFFAVEDGAIDDVVFLEDSMHLEKRSHPILALRLLLS